MTARTAPPPTTPLRVTMSEVPTRGGTLALLISEDGVVRASGYQDAQELRDRLRAAGVETEVVAQEAPPEVLDALAAYDRGDLTALDRVPVEQPGGPFYQEVWREMRQIPAGRTLTYAELAEVSGRPRAVRAAGGACARNLVAPFVPCHRVVRSDGSLGGYAYGLLVKERLLSYEREVAATTSTSV